MKNSAFSIFSLIWASFFLSQFSLLAQPVDNEKLFVKHINLLTNEQTVWEVDSDLKTSESDFIPGFDGIIQNFSIEGNQLKSLDLEKIINQDPGHPDRTILYSNNYLEELLTCATIINPKFVLASGNAYLSAAGSPDKIVFADFNFIINRDDYCYTFASDIYFFAADTLDLTNNLALIKLVRPIGAITSWMGYGFYTGETFYKENKFYITHLDHNENGFELHKYSAVPDIFYDNNFLFKRNKILTNGGAYYRDPGITYGIITHEAWTNDGVYYDGATRITQEKFNTINSIIGAATPAVPDIMPLHLTVKPKFISVLSPLNDLAFYLHNYSSANFSGPITVDIHLSKNKEIDKNDEKLISYTYNATMPPLKTFRIAPSNKPTIPATIKPGKYYIGAIISTDDFDTFNNTTYDIDCDTIIVENPLATSYISGKIISSGESPGEGWCMLFRKSDNYLSALYDITEVDENLNFEFKDILTGNYIIYYIPKYNNNHRNIPTYYNQTPHWQNAMAIEAGISDSIKNIEIERIEIPEQNGTKSISGFLTKNDLKSFTNKDSVFFSDVTIIALKSDNQSILGYTKTDTTGYYIIEHLPAETYNITVEKPGYTVSKSHSIHFTNETHFSNVNFIFLPDSTIEASGNVTYSPLILKEKNVFEIYPNPTSEFIKVKTTLPIETQKIISIYSINGNCIKTLRWVDEKSAEINIRDLPLGLYFVKMETADEVYSGKFVKK
jgi:hypothetical protein